MIHDGTGSVWGDTCWYLVVLDLDQYRTVMVDTWWYWVSIGQHWLVVGGAGSVWSGTDWYLIVLGQYSLILLGIK